MSADMNEKCGHRPEGGELKYTAKYTSIRVVAGSALVVVAPAMFSIMTVATLPIVPVIKARTKRGGVSPLIDFMISKFKPR